MRAHSLRLSSVLFMTVLTGLTVVACSDGPVAVSDPDPSTSLTAAPAPGGPSRTQEARFAPGQVLALFEPGADIGTVASRHGATVNRAVGLGIRLLTVAEGAEQTVASALASNPEVRFAEPNWIHLMDLDCQSATGTCAVPNDPAFPTRWDLHNDGTVRDASGQPLANTGQVDADVDWVEAFDLLGDFQGSAVVGMLDSGINPAHEEFSGRIVAARNFHDDPYFPVGVDPAAWADDSGHGSHTAALAAGGGNNGVGVSGIAYGPNIGIAAGKVCGPILLGLLYGCTESAIISGIDWAVNQGANVLSMSFGGPQAAAGEQTALAAAVAAGVLPVCAAGNDAGPVGYPAAFPECLGVSATDWSDGLAAYSSFGPEVALSAPGGDDEHPSGYSYILSAWIGGPSAYVFAAGTSMATPEVAGLATLLHALGATGVQEKIDLMSQNADDLGAPGPDNQFGSGRINVFRAVQAVVGAPPPPPGPPTAQFDHDCSQLTCSFTDRSSDDSGIITWSWDFGDGSPTSADQNPSHAYAAAGSYTVTLSVTAADGGSDATIVNVTVFDNVPPTAAFSEQCADLSCSFTDESSDSDGSVTGWDWDFGDGSSSTEQDPNHSFPAAGTYNVSLTITDDSGASNTTSHDVTVTDPPVGIILTGSGESQGGRNVVKLRWTPTNILVDVWRAEVGNLSTIIASGVKRGKYNDRTGTRGPIDLLYFVCETGNPNNCSNLILVSF